jgi:hypothetical protein
LGCRVYGPGFRVGTSPVTGTPPPSTPSRGTHLSIRPASESASVSAKDLEQVSNTFVSSFFHAICRLFHIDGLPSPPQHLSPIVPSVTNYPIGCRANMARIRQSRPDSGLGFQVKVLNTCKLVPSSLASGITCKVGSIISIATKRAG